MNVRRAGNMFVELLTLSFLSPHASAYDLTVGLVAPFYAGWGVGDGMTFYLALRYWNNHTYTSLGGGLEKPHNASAFNITIVPIDSGCSSKISFSNTMTAFSAKGEPDIIVGDVCSSVSTVVGRFSTTLSIPMLATASQSSALSNKIDYPYLFRFSATELTDADVHVGLLTKFGVKKVVVLYFDSIRGVKQKDRLVASPAVKAMEVLAIRLPDRDLRDTGNFEYCVSAMQQAKASDSWIYVFYTAANGDFIDNENLGAKAAHAAGLLNNNTVFMFAETFYKEFAGSGDLVLEPAVHASLSGSLCQRGKTISSRYSAYLDFIREQDPHELLGMGLDDADYKDSFKNSWITDAEGLSVWWAFRFDATLAMLFALHQMKSIGANYSASTFMETLKASKMKGVYGDVSWDSSLNRQGLVYEIYQLQVLPIGAGSKSHATNSAYPMASSIVTVGEIDLTPAADGFLYPSLIADRLNYRNGLNPTSHAPLLLQAPACSDGYFKAFPFDGLDGCVPCPAGSFSTEATGACLPCSPGFFAASHGMSACEACQPDTVSNTSRSISCSLCAPGRAQDEAGKTACEDCPAGTAWSNVTRACEECESGTANNLPGQTVCAPCEPGSFSGSKGAVRCSLCSPGTVALEAGQSQCEACQVGTYTEKQGTRSCSPCEVVLNGSTSIRGSVSSTECVCPTGTFMKGTACVTCADGSGLICPEGRDPPLQEAGHYVDVLDVAGREYSVYRCRNFAECPTGSLGSCASGRQGVACNDCLDRHMPESDGTCQPCNWMHIMTLPLVGLGFVALVGIFALLMRGSDAHQSLTLLTVLMTGGQLVAAVQALGAMRGMNIMWPEPAKTLLDLAAALAFDLNMLNLSCFMPSDNPVTKLAVQLVAYPVFIACLAIVYSASKKTKYRLEFDFLFNLNGVFLFAIYTALCLQTLLPLQCISNPNGTYSVLTHPGVTCFDNQTHWIMVALTLLGIIMYPVAIFAWAIYATKMYKSRVSSGAGLQMNRRYRFLFARFRHEIYYFGVIYLFRNFCIALVPVLFAAAPGLQLVAMGSVLLITAMYAARSWPWRTDIANFSDSLISISLLIALLAAAPMLDISQASKGRFLGIVISIILIAMLLAAVGTIAFALYQRYKPVEKYGMFLCHHKEGAGALCRFLKLAIARHTSANIFLDSDELEDLDLIFDVVEHRTSNLVILLSPEVLTRMWCAGEMATAHKHGIPIVPVLCDGFEKLDEAAIEAVPDVWSDGQKYTLLTYGITMDMIKDTYRHIMKLPFIEYPRMASIETQGSAVIDLIKACNIAQRTGVTALGRASQPGILVAGAVEDVEARAACQIFQQIVTQQMQMETDLVKSDLELHEIMKSGSAQYIVVILSRGLLRDPTFAKLILAAHEYLQGEAAFEFVTVMGDTGFQFPSADYYHEVEKYGLRMPGLGADEGPKLSAAYRNLLSVLALPYTPLGSHGLLNQQVSEISRRFKTLANGTRTSMCSTMSLSKIPQKADISANVDGPVGGPSADWPSRNSRERKGKEVNEPVTSLPQNSEAEEKAIHLNL